MRRTKAQLKVAAVLLADPNARHWGFDLSRRSGVRSGVLYPMLSRLLDAGWLTNGWEDPNAMTERRPPRRYYTLTAEGKKALSELVGDRTEGDQCQP